MTKAEIYLLIEEEEEIYSSSHFCPLIKENCNTACVCFERLRPVPVKGSPKKFNVTKNQGCRNSMFGF